MDFIKNLNIDIIKTFAPYIVSIFSAVIAYAQAKKGFKTEIDKLETQHKNSLETMLKQHEVDIENLKQQHKMAMEAKEKDYQHEIEMQKLKSEATIKEKNEELMGNAMSSVMGNVFQGLLNGNISPESIEKLAKKFPNKK